MLRPLAFALLLVWTAGAGGSSAQALHAAARRGDAATVRALLAASASSAAPLADALHEGKTAVIAALEGRHAEFDRHWPAFDASPHRETLAALLAGGATAALLCPTLEAATYRNAEAMELLLARMNSSSVRRCLAAGDSGGRSAWHVAAESPAAGLARVLSRADKLPAGHSAAALLRALQDEVSLSAVPTFSSETRELRRAGVEATLGTADIDVMARHFLRAGGSSAEFAAEVEADSSGLTPLLIACLHGRPAVVRRLLRLGLGDSLRLASVAGTSSPGELGGRSPQAVPYGSHCSHLAAQRGHVDVLRVLFEEQGILALMARDASGRTACDRMRSAGAMWSSVVLALDEFGACRSNGSGADVNERIAAWALPTAGRRLRHFDARAHSLRGWRRASESQLRLLGLPADLFSRTVSAVSLKNNASAPDKCDGVDHDATSSLSTADVDAEPQPGCLGVEIDLVDLKDLRVLRRHQSQGRPFLAERAFAPQLLLGLDASRESFLRKFGELHLRAGAIPYAASYGAAEIELNASAFVMSHMGRTSATKALMTLSAGAEAAEVSDVSGPDSENERPPYVFDGEALRRNARLFAAFIAWLPESLGKQRASLQQLVLGPPLSGAMPHFHPDAVNVLVFGLKLWLLWLPADAAFSDAHARDFFVGHARRAAAECHGGSGRPFMSFFQEPGDLVYVPSTWGHAVLNLADSFALAIE